MDRKEIMLTTFIDIKSAFDNTSYESMVQAARNCEVQTTLGGPHAA